MATGTSKAYIGAKLDEPIKEGVATADSGGNVGYSGSPGYSSPGYSKPGSSAPVDPDAQKKNQATVDNLADVYGRKKKDLEDKTKNQLAIIESKQKANDKLLSEQQRNIKTQNVWQPQQQKEQSTLMALRNRMGNAAYGSGIVDLMEGLGRVDDMADSEAIQTYKDNMNAAHDNWYQAAVDLTSDYNESLNEAQSAMTDLLNQYQAALNNVNPLAATTKNINAAASQGSRLASAQTAKKEADKALNAALAAFQNTQFAKNMKSKYGISDPEQAAKKAISTSKTKATVDAAKAYLDAIKKSKTTTSDLKAYKSGSTPEIKSALKDIASAKTKLQTARKAAKSATTPAQKKAANDAVKNAEAILEAARNNRAAAEAANKKYAPITVGSGTEQITIPSIDIKPSDEFNAYKMQKMPAVRDASVTPRYFRPDNADTHIGGARGAFNTATEANSAYRDNLYAFRDPRIRSASLARHKAEAAAANANAASTSANKAATASATPSNAMSSALSDPVAEWIKSIAATVGGGTSTYMQGGGTPTTYMQGGGLDNLAKTGTINTGSLTGSSISSPGKLFG